jgi:hypothetical protein
MKLLSGLETSIYGYGFCIEPVHKTVLGINFSEERNMLVDEKFLRSLVDLFGKHTVYTDGGTW